MSKLPASLRALRDTAIVILAAVPLLGCTIFVLTDADHTLFFNNENTEGTNTHIWFIPGRDGYFGAVYLGLDDGGAQGGMNTAGLALDWVAQFDEEWTDDGTRPMVRGNYGERMLEECATVEEAIAFFRKYFHPTFANTRALVADRSGASVIIGAEDGRMYIELASVSRGFGTGFDEAMQARMASRPPSPTLENGFRLLQQVKEDERSQTPTRYSSAFDLRTGAIHVMDAGRTQWITLQLEDELALGPHHYTIESLHAEQKPSPRPLRINMHRSLSEAFPPFPDDRPALTRTLRRVLTAFRAGNSRSDDFTPEFWSAIQPELRGLRAEMKALGELRSVVPVDAPPEEGSGRLYRLDFATGIAVARVIAEPDGRIAELSFAAFEPRGRE